VTRPLRDHMTEPSLDEARLERQFANIRDRAEAPRGEVIRGPWVAAGGLALAAAAAAGLFFFYAPEAAPEQAEVFDGAHLESGADEVRVELRDGTQIALDPQSRLELASHGTRRVALAVERGTASFDVPHVEGRSFVVRARDVEVHVIGTRFSVSSLGDGEDVIVTVTEGVVEVRRPGSQPRRVSAGEELRIDRAPREATTPDAEPSVEPEPDTAQEATTRRPRPRPTAADLWARATEARRAGDAREAATAYEAFLRLAPRDSQAALAAFELGRLRMDRLGDVRGAIEALRRALSTAPGAPFAEDAQARLVDAYARAGQRDACAAARDRYLSRYPSGAHRRSVEARCDSR